MTAQQQLAQLESDASPYSSTFAGGQLSWRYWSGPAGSRPLILLHGGFGSWTHWAANIRRLRQERSLWVVDLPGLGTSSDIDHSCTVTQFADIVLDGIDQLLGTGCAFDLAGFSFGALVGARLAESVQTRCDKFVACGAAGFGDLHVQVDLLRPPTAATSEEEAQRIHRHNLQALMIHDESRITPLAVAIHGRNLALARFNSRRLARSDEFSVALPGISADLCGIWGSMDATAGGPHGIDSRREQFIASAGKSRFHVLENTGHWAMFESPDVFNQLVLDHLRG